MKRLIIILIFITYQLSSHAQKGWKVLEYTRLDWAGGIAGKGGTNFQITLKKTKSLTAKPLSKIIIGGKPYDIPVLNEQTHNSQISFFQSLDKTQYIIRLNISIQESQSPNIEPNTSQKTKLPKYDCIIIESRKGKKLKTIKLPPPIIFPPVNYP